MASRSVVRFQAHSLPFEQSSCDFAEFTHSIMLRVAIRLLREPTIHFLAIGALL